MRHITVAAFLMSALLGCSRSPPPPLRVSESELAGTYAAQTQTWGHVLKGSIELRADGTFVLDEDYRGGLRKRAGTWTTSEFFHQTRLELSFARNQHGGELLQTLDVEDYGGRLAILWDPDVGLRYVKRCEDIDAGQH